MTIEKRLEHLEKKYTTLYHRYYAMIVRRSEVTKQQSIKARRLVNNYEKNNRLIQRAAASLTHRRPGRGPMYLTLSQRNKLEYWLKKDFRKE